MQLLGAALLLSRLLLALRWAWRHLWWPAWPQAARLRRRYGPGSWALITGAGDGLGRAFAEQLAQAGFHLLLVSRTAGKLERLRERLELHGVQVRILAVDLAGDPEPTAERLRALAAEVDLAMVLHCAGTTVHRRFADVPAEALQALLTVNVRCTAAITHALLPLLLRHATQSGRRAALINVGSIVGRFPWPGTQIYGATKSFIDRLTVPLGVEYKEQLDVLSFQPTVMATAMAAGTEPAALTIRPEQAAAAALAHLGRLDRSHGHWRHALAAALLSATPRWLRDRLFLAEALKMGEVEMGRGGRA